MKNHIPSYNDFVNESINEGSDVDPRVKKEAISKLSDFFRVSPNALSHLKFDGKDPIKDVTKSLNATSRHQPLFRGALPASTARKLRQRRAYLRAPQP